MRTRGKSSELPRDPAARGSAAHGPPSLGPNLRRLRTRRGLSLERLAKASAVSRAMLSQIELGHSTPTINVLSRICGALGVRFSTLVSSEGRSSVEVLRAGARDVLPDGSARTASRALTPHDAPGGVAFHEVRVAVGAEERLEGRGPGTTEYLVLRDGAVEIDVGPDRVTLREGDAVVFAADAPHAYRNLGAREAILYRVLTPADPTG